MGSTSVNDVGNLLGGLNASVQAQMVNRISSNVSSDTSSNSPSFESILNAGIAQEGASGTDLIGGIGKGMADNKPSFDQKKNSDRIAGEDKREAGKTSRTDEKQDKVSGDKKISSESKTDKSGDTPDAEDIEKAEEALSTAAITLLERIENILQISPEEAQDLLNALGMTAEDLLNIENLSAFALQAMGAEDSLALLTDESKYEQFQNIAEALEELLKSGSDIEGLSVEELRDLVKDMKSIQGNDVNAAASEDKSISFGEDISSKLGDESAVKSSRETDNLNGNEAGNAYAGAENMAQNPATVPVTAGDGMGSLTSANAQQIADQILDYIKTNVKADSQTLEMQLHPASLGNVQISLTNRGGNISASFIAQNEQVRAVLETQMIQLQQRFEEQGIKVTSIEVSVGTNSFSENLEQQGHREEEQEAGRPRRVRRLQITPGMDIPEEMDEEERLAAEMMTANGSTMDLQA